MSVTGILGKSNLDRLQVEIEPPGEIYDGVATLLTLRLHNRRRLLPGFLLKLTMGEDRALLPYITRQGDGQTTIPLRLTGRGYHDAPAITVSSAFPVNFFIRARTFVPECQLLVFPAPQPCTHEGESGRKKQREGTPAASQGNEGELRQINDYRGGEPVRLIHWRLTAKHDSLKVREFSATQREPLIIEPLNLPGRTVEEQLRQAVFLVDHGYRNGRPIGLKLPHVTLPAAVGRPHKHQLLTELALYGQHPHST